MTWYFGGILISSARYSDKGIRGVEIILYKYIKIVMHLKHLKH